MNHFIATVFLKVNGNSYVFDKLFSGSISKVATHMVGLLKLLILSHYINNCFVCF